VSYPIFIKVPDNSRLHHRGAMELKGEENAYRMHERLLSVFPGLTPPCLWQWKKSQCQSETFPAALVY
jgi:hypothetical protein